jgi:hypothetical protein
MTSSLTGPREYSRREGGQAGTVAKAGPDRSVRLKLSGDMALGQKGTNWPADRCVLSSGRPVQRSSPERGRSIQPGGATRGAVPGPGRRVPRCRGSRDGATAGGVPEAGDRVVEGRGQNAESARGRRGCEEAAWPHPGSEVPATVEDHGRNGDTTGRLPRVQAEGGGSLSGSRMTQWPSRCPVDYQGPASTGRISTRRLAARPRGVVSGVSGADEPYPRATICW